MRVRPCDKFFYLLVIRKVRPGENQTGLMVTMAARTANVRFVSILFGFTTVRRTCSTPDPILTPRALIDGSDARRD